MKYTTYLGFTRLLDEPLTAGEKKYPFAFDCDRPTDLHTSFRLVKTSAPKPLTDELLADLLRQSRRGSLRSDLDHCATDRRGWIVVHPDDGEHGDTPICVRIEPGPSLTVSTPNQSVANDGVVKDPNPEDDIFPGQ
jgi:hypothetical protein